MKSTDPQAPYIVPPFDPGNRTTLKFRWWTWHPAHVKDNNPSGWSPMCWEAPTEAEAMAMPEQAGFPQQYHCKLIREGDTFTEIFDRPCADVSGWVTFKDRRAASGVKTEADKFANPNFAPAA